MQINETRFIYRVLVMLLIGYFKIMLCAEHSLQMMLSIITSNETVDLLKHETPDFIPPSLWPQNSPGLSPVDYKIWGVLQQRAYSRKIQIVDELRQRIFEEWERLDHRVIDDAVKRWRRRLRSCVAAKGGHFEQSL